VYLPPRPLAVETWQFDSNGIIARSWRTPFRAVAIRNLTTGPVTATSGPPAAAADPGGPAVASIPAGAGEVVELAGHALTLYGPPGGSVTIEVYRRTIRPAYRMSTAPTPPPTPPTIVQDLAGSENATPTLTLTPAAPFTPGHGLTLCVDINLIAGISAVTSDNGDIWQRIEQALEPSGNPLAAELWYCHATAGGSPTITVTASGDSTITVCDLSEWSTPLTAVIGQSAANQGTGATWSLDTVNAGISGLTLWTMCNNDHGPTGAPPAGFTALAGNTGQGFDGFIEFGYLTGPAITTAGGDTTGTSGWAAAIAVLTA
jgi:hypothetical protein